MRCGECGKVIKPNKEGLNAPLFNTEFEFTLSDFLCRENHFLLERLLYGNI